MTKYDDPEPKPYIDHLFEDLAGAGTWFFESPAGTIATILTIILEYQSGRIITAGTLAVILAVQATTALTDRDPLQWLTYQIVPKDIAEIELDLK